MEFNHVSYKKHADEFVRDITDEKQIAKIESWFRKDTANFWRHERMYEAVDFLKSERDGKWLTVGDGRFGLDAVQLRQKGIPNVLPTDISETLLRKSKEQGLIERFAIENAESLSFSDGEFDYVFCKESYHHFPRPALALYEMLRVAKRGIVLIEPNDPNQIFLRKIKHLVKILVKGKSHVDAGYYEETGNYIYSISRREMEKVALGMNLPFVVIKGLNDHYIDGCEFHSASWKSPVYRRIRVKCALKNLFSRTFLYDYNLLMVVLFKQPPSDAILSQFRHGGWSVVELPRNPYVD
jgi:ubiquinone/menaquinone biosynthesis C-methylase UbiE